MTPHFHYFQGSPSNGPHRAAERGGPMQTWRRTVEREIAEHSLTVTGDRLRINRLAAARVGYQDTMGIRRSYCNSPTCLCRPLLVFCFVFVFYWNGSPGSDQSFYALGHSRVKLCTFAWLINTMHSRTVL